MDFIVIEDHELVREGVTKLIEEKSGHTCEGKCKSIKEAISLLKPYVEKDNKVICLVDMNLGEEDGVDFIKCCTAEYKNVLCIAYTMYSGAGIIGQALDAGAKGYVAKSADIAELLASYCWRNIRRFNACTELYCFQFTCKKSYQARTCGFQYGFKEKIN